MKRALLSLLFLSVNLLWVSCASSDPQLPLTIPDRQMELIDAVRNPRRNDLAKVVAQSGTLNFYDTQGITPLEYAVMMENQDKLKILLDSGADPLFHDYRGFTALHVAASQGNADALRTLLKRGISPDVPGMEEKTPLMEALRIGNVEIVQLLIQKKADIKRKDKLGRVPLSFAAMARSNSLEQVKLLLQHGAVRAVYDDNGWTPLFHAIRAKNTGSAIYLLSLLPDFNTGTATDVIGIMAMKHAIAAENVEVAEAIIRKHLNINADISIPYRAMEKANIEGLHEFFARNGVIEDGKTPLFWAAERDSVIMIRFLAEHGANPGQRDYAGNRPINYARRFESVRLLKDIQKEYAEAHKETVEK